MKKGREEGSFTGDELLQRWRRKGHRRWVYVVLECMKT
jgi:hypothetical protein